jgi:hypothetical protein
MYFRITEVPNTFALSDEQIRVNRRTSTLEKAAA